MSDQIAQRADLLASVIDAQRDAALFWPRLDDYLGAFVAFDGISVLLFQSRQAPVLTYSGLDPEERKLLHETYINGAYILDPCVQRAERKEWGYYDFKEIVPNGYSESQLYRDYYSHSLYRDEVGYVFTCADDVFINIALGHREEFAFTDQDKANLVQLERLIGALVGQFWQGCTPEAHQENGGLHREVFEVLEHFGTSLLTDRELEVVRLILKGYSTQMISDRLDISGNTVKLHRKNAYAKLDVSSQNELFRLFLDSLQCAGANKPGDPLVAYSARSA